MKLLAALAVAGGLMVAAATYLILRDDPAREACTKAGGAYQTLERACHTTQGAKP